MPEANPQPQHATREDLLKEFQLNPIAFLRQLGNARVPPGQAPNPNTHLLAWKCGKSHDKSLFGEDVINFLLDYILKLETQLAIDAAQFRQKSIKDLVVNRHLTGFDKV